MHSARVATLAQLKVAQLVVRFVICAKVYLFAQRIIIKYALQLVVEHKVAGTTGHRPTGPGHNYEAQTEAQTLYLF